MHFQPFHFVKFQFHKQWQVFCNQYNFLLVNPKNVQVRNRLFQWLKMEQWPSGQGAGFLIQASRAQNHWVAPRLTQPFILPRSIK